MWRTDTGLSISTPLRRLSIGALGLVAAYLVAPGPRSAYAGCPTATCGGNSPIVNGFPINGLRLDTAGGVVLVPKLTPDPRGLLLGRCWGVSRLGVKDGAFVGLRPDNTQGCAGADLIGATFGVEVGGSLAPVTIAEMTEIDTWTRPHARVPAYLLTSSKNGGKAICTEPAAWLGPDEQVPALAEPTYAQALTEPAAGQRALLIVGERYDLDTAEVVRDPDGGRWFNIACQGGALAKMRLLGYDPEREPARVDERQATLKMITARYCDEISYTEVGVVIQWLRKLRGGGGLSVEWRQDESGDLRTIEARWGKGGALCLSQPRLSSVDADATRARCHLEVCGTAPPSHVAQARPSGPVVYWTTRAVTPRSPQIMASVADAPGPR